MPDHVHMMLSIPPKYAVSQVVGYIKGKSAIHLARVYGERKRNFVGQQFLGPRVLCFDGGSGRDGDSRVHPEPGAGGRAIGPAEPVAMTGHRSRWPKENRGRVSDPTMPL